MFIGNLDKIKREIKIADARHLRRRELFFLKIGRVCRFISLYGITGVNGYLKYYFEYCY